MQKYILILTRREYVGAFLKFVLTKQNLGFQVEFALVDDISFSSFDKFKAFVRTKNPDTSLENAFYLLIGGSELYYDINSSFGDFQYAQCSDIADDKSMYCTVGRIPGRNIAEIEAVCNNVLRCGSIQRRQLNLLPIVATEKNRNFWNRTFSEPYLLPMDTTANAEEVLSKDVVIEEIKLNNFILHMGHGSRRSLALRQGIRLKVDDIPEPQSGYFHIWAWACSTCKEKENSCSLGENCLLQNKAVSFWGARGVTYGGSNRKSYRSFVQELCNLNTDRTIGEIYFKTVMRNAFSDFNFGNTNLLRNAMQYMFLGDPTMLVTV